MPIRIMSGVGSSTESRLFSAFEEADPTLSWPEEVASWVHSMIRMSRLRRLQSCWCKRAVFHQLAGWSPNELGVQVAELFRAAKFATTNSSLD